MNGLDRIKSWHRRATIPYAPLFLAEYVAYASWYKIVTKSADDKTALLTLKRTGYLWDEYLEGGVLQDMQPIITKIVGDWKNWPAVIDMWYQVRCRLIHGEKVDVIEVKNAYLSLSCYMNEVVKRLDQQFNGGDARRLYELEILTHQDMGEYKAEWAIEKRRLQQKYLSSTSYVSHDLTPVRNSP